MNDAKAIQIGNWYCKENSLVGGWNHMYIKQVAQYNLGPYFFHVLYKIFSDVLYKLVFERSSQAQIHFVAFCFSRMP